MEVLLSWMVGLTQASFGNLWTHCFLDCYLRRTTMKRYLLKARSLWSYYCGGSSDASPTPVKPSDAVFFIALGSWAGLNEDSCAALHLLSYECLPKCSQTTVLRRCYRSFASDYDARLPSYDNGDACVSFHCCSVSVSRLWPRHLVSACHSRSFST